MILNLKFGYWWLILLEKEKIIMFKSILIVDDFSIVFMSVDVMFFKLGF